MRPILSPDRRLTPHSSPEADLKTPHLLHHDGRRRRQVSAPLVGLPSPDRPRHREVLGYDASVSSARIGCSSSPPQVARRVELLRGVASASAHRHRRCTHDVHARRSWPRPRLAHPRI